MLPDTAKTVGRSTGADFILDAALVSRVHCRVSVRPTGELDVTDLASTNGTFVNGTRIAAPTSMTNGDRLGVGRVELVVLRDE